MPSAQITDALHLGGSLATTVFVSTAAFIPCWLLFLKWDSTPLPPPSTASQTSLPSADERRRSQSRIGRAGGGGRVLPPLFYRLYFTAWLAWLTCTTSFLSFFLALPSDLGLVAPHTTHMWNAILCSVIFRITFFMNPQIRVHIDDSGMTAVSPAQPPDNGCGTAKKARPTKKEEQPEGWSSLPTRACLLANHTSFLDALLVVAFSPTHTICNSKTLMKSTLRRLPIFGPIFDRVGHFPVYFKSDDVGGGFSVDKERQASVNVRVLEHIEKHHGRLSIFPEGQINSSGALLAAAYGNVNGGGGGGALKRAGESNAADDTQHENEKPPYRPSTLLPFRHGTFATVMQTRMEVFYCLMWGNDVVWAPPRPRPPRSGPTKAKRAADDTGNTDAAAAADGKITDTIDAKAAQTPAQSNNRAAKGPSKIASILALLPAGGPHDIYIKVGRIGFAKGREGAAREKNDGGGGGCGGDSTAASAEEAEDCVAFSQRCQSVMQKELDAMIERARREGVDEIVTDGKEL